MEQAAGFTNRSRQRGIFDLLQVSNVSRKQVRFKMAEDSSGNQYEEVSNVRLTYVSQASRSSAKDWSEGDVLRIQAYRGEGDALHQGPEVDLKDPGTILELIEALARLYRAESAENSS